MNEMRQSPRSGTRRLGATRRLLPFVVAPVIGAGGCGGRVGDATELSDYEQPSPPPEWPEFKADATRHGADGSLYYVVEEDIPMRTEKELRAYYDQLLSGKVDKGVVHLYNGSEDVWQNNDQLFLRYCVDTDRASGFGAPPVGGVSASAMIDAMAQATEAWERLANIRFEYDAGNNNNCGRTDPIPDSKYIKISRDDT